MLYVLLFKSLFHNGEKDKYPFHRKQFVFKRRGVLFQLSLSSSVPLHSQSSCTISTTQANQDQGQRYFLAPKYQRPILLIWDSILLLTLPTSWGRQPRPVWPVALEQSLLLFQGPLEY